MGMVQEFKAFALRGNVFDMAVGIIIGAAFGKVVSSFVSDVMTPPLGMAMGKTDFSELGIEIGKNAKNEAVKINYGPFIQTCIDFVIIAFCVFLLVKGINRMMKKAPPPPAAPTRDQQLLEEIRDLLKAKR